MAGNIDNVAVVAEVSVIAEDIEESVLSSGGPKRGRKSYSLSTKLDVFRKYDELGQFTLLHAHCVVDPGRCCMPVIPGVYRHSGKTKYIHFWQRCASTPPMQGCTSQ